jgi:SAM-dependent methyltransferase
MTALPFALPAPAGSDHIPVWTGRGFQLGQESVPVLEYSENFAGWSDDLTTLHEETAGDAHPIDLASRTDALRQLQRHLAGKSAPVIMEIGCSSGFLLRDISTVLPNATLVGADVVKMPLYRLAEKLPHIPLLRFDLLQCPLPDASFDAVVLLNVLEHIEDDVRALQQLYRLLKPGGIAVIEVPAGPALYDAYDKALMHFRRYGMAELATKLTKTGFSITRQSHLGCFLYPAFAYVKHKNQKNPPQDLQALVKKQANDTSSSFLMKTIMGVETALGSHLSYPVGIRCLVTAKKPNEHHS